MKTSRTLRVLLATIATPLALHAQDTRTVTEPTIPPACTVLKAQLHATNGTFASEDNTQPDTTRIQSALDHCPKGQAVELASDASSNAFLSGPLQLRTGVTLLVDKATTLYASRNPKDFEVSPNSCGIINTSTRPGCKPFLSATGPDIALMGDGIIDGRGNAKMTGTDQSWWDLPREIKLTGKGRQQVPRLIDTDHTDNLIFYRITLRNSAMTHIAVHHSNGVTVWGLKIDTPSTALNTDGFDPAASTNITVTHSFIRDGDDNIAIKAGDGPVTHMSVLHNHFYSGHGMSIGSETTGGVSTLLVRDLSLDGTTWGIRLKSNATRGGIVDGATYDDICIRNSKLPISVTTNYFLPGTTPDSLPVFRNILLHNVRISGGTRFELNGFDPTHRLAIQFDNVQITDNPTPYKSTIAHADITLGPGPVNLPLTGAEDSTLRGKPTSTTPAPCTDKFVPFLVTQ